MKVCDLQNKWVTYHYLANRDYTAISDRFIRNTFTALDFLYKTRSLTITLEDDNKKHQIDIIDVLIDDTENNISIVPGDRNAYNPEQNSVMFLDTHGVVFRKNHRKQWFRKNRGYNSPVSLLSHELIHCYNEIYNTQDYLARKRDHSSRRRKIDYDGNDLSFPNAEEVLVVKMTNQVAHRLGEDKRSNYGRSYYPTQGVLTTKLKKVSKKL